MKVQELLDTLNKISNVKSAIFVGQCKEYNDDCTTIKIDKDAVNDIIDLIHNYESYLYKLEVRDY